MTDRLRANPYAPYHHGEPRRTSVSGDEGLSTKKTMLVLVVVVGCFAVLWPKLFYPMLVSNANSQMKPGPVDKTTGCCDVISELDLDTIKIMSELCGTIIDTRGIPPPGPQEIVTQCRKAVLETCGIDIAAALQDRIVSLGHSVRQILEEVRSLNGSLCLKYNFGLSPWRLGVPHRVNINLDPLNNIKQERPTHLRSEMVHPAFKERGRAIPQPDPSGLPRRSNPPPRIVEGRPGPIPGMRPAMGGPGHMVAPSKQSNYGFMGVLMPIYTIGFVVFFTYTVMKLVFKKKTEAHVGAPLYPPCEPDERFHKEVFEANKNTYFHRPSRDSSKIGDEELDQLRKRLRETELAMERIVEQMAQAPLVTQDETRANGSLHKEDEQGTVKVMGMETTASCESGKRWSRPDSPVLPHPHLVAFKEPSPPLQQIFLEGALPPQSHILVAESATEAQKDSEDDSPVVLAGKMTLSVISLDSETGTEDSSNSGRKAEISDEERRRSSSNVSEEFEKINAADLEDQINSIIEEAENTALTEENRYSLDAELDKFTEEIYKAPQINEKDKDNDVLEEIKNQLNLEDDLLLALKEKEPEGKVSLPVTDIIKEFLDNEENALLTENKDVNIGDIRKEDLGVVERDERSLNDERDGEEIDLTEDLDEDEDISDIIRKYEGDSPVNDQEDLDVLERQHDQTAEETADLDSVNDHLIEEVDKTVNSFVGKELKGLKEELNFESLSVASQKAKASSGLENKEHEIDAVLLTEETIVNLEEKESKPVKLHQEIATESSKDEHKDSVSEQINRSRETTPGGTNKADLLLQGLMVKDDVELDDRAKLASDDERKILDVPSTDTTVEKDDQEKHKSTETTEDVLPLTEEDKQLIQDEDTLQIDRPLARDSCERLNAKVEDSREGSSSGITDEEGLIDDEDYDDTEEEDLVDDEVRDINEVYEDRRESMERRLNGEDVDVSRNGGYSAENEIYEEEDLENDDDEEIEEIIEYVDNTDDEGEEIVEINGNEQIHLNENGAN